MRHSEQDGFTRQQSNSFGVSQDQREQILLDDLQHEISRLADAVERQNELLEASSPGEKA
jgi:hypothetical protein